MILESIKTQLHQQALYTNEKIVPNLSKNEIIKDTNLLDSEIAIIKDGLIVHQTKYFTLKNFQEYLLKDETFVISEYNNERGEEVENAIYVMQLDENQNSFIVIYKKNIDNKAEAIEDILKLLNPFLMLLLILAGSKLIDKILIQIKKISKTTKEIDISNFSNTIELPSDEDELTELIESFNNMIIRIKSGVDVLDRFNNDVSHELKTPLTVIKGEIEITLQTVREPEYYIKSLNTIYYEANQIQQLVEELLLLTKYSKDNIKKTFEHCYLDAILLNVVDKYSTQLKKKNIDLQIDKLESINIEANALLIYTIFSNILDNAIKFIPQGKTIYISLYKNHTSHFIIKDEGVGIAKDQLSKITDRFYRVDTSRNKQIKGFGLGLSIVKNSVELHNGKLKISSEEGVGTTVHIEL